MDGWVMLLRLLPPCSVSSCSVFSQEFGLARFKSNQVKAMKGLEYALSNLQGMCTSPTETEKYKEKAKGKQNSLFLTVALS